MSIGNEALAAAIRNRLLQDCRIAASAIDISSIDGCVRLTGLVDTAEQKTLVVRLVTGLIGVRSIKDELVVNMCASSTGMRQL